MTRLFETSATPALRAAACTVLLTTACARLPGAVDRHHEAAASAIAAVRAELSSSLDAWNRGDLDAHVAVYSDSASLLPSAPPGRGRADARRSFARFFAIPAERPALELADLSARALGRDHVLVYGRYVLTGGTVRGPRTGWFTEIWERTRAGWRIVHDHST